MFGVKLPTTGPVARPLVSCNAKKSGFGMTGTLQNQGKKASKRSRPSRTLQEVYESKEEEGTTDGAIFRRAGKPIGKYWFQLATLSDFKAGRDKCLCTTQTGQDLIVYKAGEKMFCSDAKSTAYEFPLIDAKISEGNNGPELEVPLDGTRYLLDTGEVLEWCPKNNPLRAFLGTLKSAQEPKPLAMYDCVLTEADEIYVRLTRE